MLKFNTINIYILYLILAAFFWGATFPLTKLNLDYLSPINLLFFRFLLATIFLIIFFLKFIIVDFKKVFTLKVKKNHIFYLILFSLANFFGIFFQTLGLKYIDPSNSAFITSLYIFFIPLFSFCIFKKFDFSKEFLISFFIAIFGIYIMSYGFKLPDKFLFGDLLTLFCAIIYGLYIVLASSLSNVFSSPFIITFAFFITTILFLPFINIEDLNFSLLDVRFFVLFLLLVVLGTILPYILMVKGQQKINAILAGLIYLLEPVSAFLLSVLFCVEILYFNKLLGSILVVLSQYYVIKKNNFLS